MSEAWPRRIIVRPRPAAVRVDPHNGRCERIGVSCVAIYGLHARAANHGEKHRQGELRLCKEIVKRFFLAFSVL